MGRKDHAIRIMQRSRETDRTENPGRDVLQIFHHEPRRGFLRGLAGVGAGLTVLQTTGIAEAARNKRARGSAYVGERWSSALVFVILVVILIFRPAGILGATRKEKV